MSAQGVPVFDTYPTLRSVWIRLSFDLGRTWENENATWAAEMLTAARYTVHLSPDLRNSPPDAPGQPEDDHRLGDDLITRRGPAQAKGWAGEFAALDLTLLLLRATRDDTQRRTQRPTVHVCIPARIAGDP
ncbi:hypothetical protein AB5J55_41600 [Streptomyces sp. R11]|uniref:Uncharacterized protein n=1 Tax=Streptomyces sp. R11 TaxID=3238625 RepID=A0AB39NCQ7_9ACTN